MKKLLSILLALILVFSLSACGGNTENPSGDSPGISQVSETNNNESKGAELFDITDTEINASSDNSGDANSADQWKNATYSAYTGGVAEPAFNYTIKGVIMDQLTINAEATVDEVNAWKQSLLAAGFEEYREGEQWGISNETHNIQMNGFVNGVAYIYISLQG